MTSRNYLFNGIKENIRRNFYLMILSVLAFFTVLPFQTIMRLDQARHTDYMETRTLTYVEQTFLECIGADNIALAFVIIAAAAILGMAGFFYLYSGEKTDFYHSLPQKREELFLTAFISGFLIFLIPYLLGVGITYVIGVFYGAVTAKAVTAMAIAAGLSVVYFLVIYETAILAVLLTGNLFTGILGFLGLMSYGPLCYGAFFYMNNRFFETISNVTASSIDTYLSPVSAYLTALGHFSYWNTDMEGKNGFVIYGLLLAAILFVLDVRVYKIRPSESFQRAIAFRKLQPAIKVLCVLPLSLLAALVFSRGMSSRFVWLTALTLIIALILSAAFEFLYTMDVKECIKPRCSAALILGILILILAGYRLDITGVDAYLPDKDKIQSMSVYLDGINDRIQCYYEDANNVGTCLEKMTIEDFDDVYKMAEMGVDYYETKPEQESDDTVVSFYIAYHLKSGKTVYRQYMIPETEELVDTIAAVYDNWEYREYMLPTTYLDEADIDYLHINDFYHNKKQLDVQGDSLKNLYKTYKGELESMTFAQSQEEHVIGFLNAEEELIDSFGQNVIYTYAFPIYEGFDKTKALLEKAGIQLKDRIDVEDIQSIRLSRYKEDKELKQVFEDPEEIERILECLTFGEGRYIVGTPINYEVNVYIYWKNSEMQNDTPMYLQDSEKLEDLLEQLNHD